VRFEVSRVMDAIERRLTTDVALAQAVVDLGAVARYVVLDGGRPINLLRVGMVVDALGRYLVDAGALLYPVVARELLSESALTSKERMVLGRWADDGFIEVTPVVSDRVAEIADFTGVPLITVDDVQEFAGRFPWVGDSPERVLRLIPRTGSAALAPAGVDVAISASVPAIVVGKASLRPVTPEEAAPASEPEPEPAVPPSPDADETTPAEAPAAEVIQAETSAPLVPVAMLVTEDEPEVPKTAKPDGMVTFRVRGVQRFTRTRVVRRRFTRAEPSAIGASLMAREWRCVEPDCPAFGEYRRIGQPVPRMRAGVPACPRHGEAVKDVGARPPAFAIELVIDDLARLRFVVTGKRPVTVGRAPRDEDDIAVNEWLHEAAAGWIAEEHLRLEVRTGALVVTDVSSNGTLVWKRSGPDDPGTTERLYRESYQLGDWDSIELYTGVELVPGDHRLTTVVGSEPRSVLVDAPTVAVPRLA
jgi:hypothetical protein